MATVVRLQVDSDRLPLEAERRAIAGGCFLGDLDALEDLTVSDLIQQAVDFRPCARVLPFPQNENRHPV